MLQSVIGRLWHGWTTRENADAYEELLRREILPGIRGIDGYRGAYVLRREVEGGVEFATLTLWDSMDAISAFAGEDVDRAVVLPEAEELLDRFDERSAHFEIRVEP